MNRLEERIRSGLQETAERIPDTVPTRAAGRVRSTRPPGVWVAVAAVVGVLVLFTPILFLRGSDPDTTLADDPSPFLGTWVTSDLDGSTPTMVIQASQDENVEMLLHDDFDSVCSGGPSTLTGTGRLQAETQLVFPAPVLTCDDGSQPETLGGSPIEEELQTLDFTHDPGTDTLTDNFGSVWTREGADTPPSSIPAVSAMVGWPQSTMEEVQEAQERADAGDPDYTWQLEPDMESILMSSEQVDTPEILARLLREELGWEGFALTSRLPESQNIRAVGAVVIRCEAGKINPLWPNDPRFGDCAPTIDDFHYETVEIFVAQPGKQGPEGIWVVSVWSEVYPPIEQVAPLTDVEVAAIVEPFLEARIAGEGAEEYLGSADDRQHFETPFLYATSTGAPYERAEVEVEDGEIENRGPFGGGIGLLVRLFAEDDQTVVEQTFELEEVMGRWLLYQHEGDQTTENGVPLPRP